MGTVEHERRNVNGVVCFAVLCSVLLGGRAWSEEAAVEEGADEARIARARELFREGISFSDQSQWSEAVSRFEEALALHPAPSIRYNLAATYAQLNRRLEAVEQLDEVLADPETPDELAGRARELLVTLEPQLGSIEVDRSGIDGRAVVYLDAEEVTLEHQTATLRADPGSHTVTATLDGEEIAREDVEVAAGQTSQVALVAAHPVEQAIVEVATEPEPPPRTPLARSWRLWVGVSAGVVAVALAVGLGVGLGTADEEFEDPVPGTMDPAVITWR
jgi:hypothetical protein